MLFSSVSKIYILKTSPSSGILPVKRPYFKELMNQFFLSIDQEAGNHIDIQIVKVQIIGPDSSLFNHVVDCFFKYNLPFSQQKLTQIGKIEQNHYSHLIPFIQEAIKNHKITIVLGYDTGTIKSVFDSFQFGKDPFSVALVHSSLGSENDITTQMVELRDPHLFDLTCIGHQANLSAPDQLKALPGLSIHPYRLGAVRENLAIVEPHIRTSDIFGVNLNSLKYHEAPNQAEPHPIGFSVEEVCQLAYYAGRGEGNKIFCLWGIDPSSDNLKIGHQILASLIWYFLYGIEYRESTYPPDENKMTSYTIDTPIDGMYLAFYKDEGQQKWWLKNPISNSKLVARYPLIACDYEDYSRAVQHQELSERLHASIIGFQHFNLHS